MSLILILQKEVYGEEMSIGSAIPSFGFVLMANEFKVPQRYTLGTKFNLFLFKTTFQFLISTLFLLMFFL